MDALLRSSRRLDKTPRDNSTTHKLCRVSRGVSHLHDHKAKSLTRLIRIGSAGRMYMRVKVRRHNESQSVPPRTGNVILINQSSPIARKELIEEGRKSIGKVFVLAMVLEIIHQVITQYLVFLRGDVLSPRSP